MISAAREARGGVTMTSDSTAAAERNSMLEVVRVTRHYGATLALDDVTLHAERGEFLTILGESGSGKTTMLRIISGLEQPSRIERLAIDGQEGVRPARGDAQLHDRVSALRAVSPYVGMRERRLRPQGPRHAA